MCRLLLTHNHVNSANLNTVNNENENNEMLFTVMTPLILKLKNFCSSFFEKASDFDSCI